MITQIQYEAQNVHLHVFISVQISPSLHILNSGNKIDFCRVSFAPGHTVLHIHQGKQRASERVSVCVCVCMCACMCVCVCVCVCVNISDMPRAHCGTEVEWISSSGKTSACLVLIKYCDSFIK